jgi:hypothetical protein
LPRDIKLGNLGTGSRGTGPPTGNNRTKHFIGDLQYAPKNAAAFFQSVKDRFEKLVETSGGKCTDLSASTDDAEAHEFQLKCDFDRESGAAKAKMRIKPNTVADYDARCPFEMEIEVEELSSP